MTDHLPVLGDELLTPGRCGYVGCAEVATHHVVWTSTPELADASPSCEVHLAETRARWVFYAVHDYARGYCDHPASRYHADVNECSVPLEGVDWDAHAAAELTAPAPAGR